jgi:uncharacterized damage-inducible protein DinB
MPDALDDLTILRTYLQRARETVLWKLEGLSERDVRRPLTPTGTNLLGVVKHLASVDVEYLGSCFGHPWPEPMPWMAEDGEHNADMWATREESREWVVDLYRRVWQHGDHTLATVGLDDLGEVPWWPEERRHPSLRRVLVHLVAETNRHAGQMDILREQLDGAVGMLRTAPNLPPEDEAWWEAYRARLQAVADELA